MKIGVVGCGALGSFYGAKLCALGMNVHFLLRSDYDAVRHSGVRIESIHGNFAVRPECANEPGAIGECELVLIGLKTTANSAFATSLPPLVGPNTLLLTLQNGLGNEELLADLFGGERVLGGLCFVCLNRIAPGVIRHTAHGDVILGEYGRLPQARTEAIATLFRQAGVRCRVTEDLAKAHWEKLVWNVPFNGLGVASAAGYEAVITGSVANDQPLGPCLTTEQLLADPQWEIVVRELMAEVISAAGTLGLDIPHTIIEERVENTRRMGAYKASTLIDFEKGQALELESLFLGPLRRAERAGAKTPRWAALCRVLSVLDPAKRVAGE